MTDSVEKALREFHIAYDLPIGDKARNFSGNNTVTSPPRRLRQNLLDEEIWEYWRAEADNDIVEIADALTDIVYIAVGTAIAYGIPFDNVFSEVHRSNMSKLDKEGNPIYREYGKVMKVENYEPPNIRKVLFKK